MCLFHIVQEIFDKNNEFNRKNHSDDVNKN